MRHFIYQDEKSHKFWAVEQQGNELHISWGKVGTKGQSQVKSFADAVGASYIYKAGKPGREGYLRAMEQMHTGVDTTLFVGDQLFTDVWGAKKCGIVTYLTKPIHPKEEIQIVLKRYLEKIVLFFYHREKRRKGNQNAE